MAFSDDLDDDMEEVFLNTDEYGEAITYKYADENGLDDLNESKARAWFINSLAGNLANISSQTLYNRMRVFRNVIERGLDEENKAVSYSVWMLLLRNLPEEDGVVDITELNKRLEWYHEEGLPTTRTVEDYIKSNGHETEGEILWTRILKNAGKMAKLELPKAVRKIIELLLLNVDVDYFGGKE